MALTIYQKFNNQKQQAKRRGIGWNLTLSQWWRIWKNSGHWHERGRLSHQYCMARNGDEGVYEDGNVDIITNAENAALRNKRHTTKGKKISKEGREAIRQGALNKKPASQKARENMRIAQYKRWNSFGEHILGSIRMKESYWYINGPEGALDRIEWIMGLG